MATKSATCLLLALMIIFCFVHGQEASSATHNIGGSENVKSAAVQLREYLHHRKMLLDMAVDSNGSAGKSGTIDIDEGELRTVPAGPDPLHHNGNPSKKPRSSIP